MDRRVALAIGAVMMAGCSAPLFFGDKALFKGEPQTLKTPYILKTDDSPPREEGVFVGLKPLSARSNEQQMRLEIVYAAGSLPETRGYKVRACLRDSSGLKVSPEKLPENPSSSYGYDCAVAAEQPVVIDDKGKELHRLVAFYKIWESRLEDLKRLTVGILYSKQSQHQGIWFFRVAQS